MDNISPPITPPLPPQPQSQPPVPSRNWWQRNWMWFVPTGCVSIIVLFVVLIAVVVLGAFGVLKSTDVYKTAVAKAKTNPQVIEALGTPISEGTFLSGSTSTNNGTGNADLSIPISGPKGKATVHAVATKSDGPWNYSTLDAKIEGSGNTIDLNQ